MTTYLPHTATTHLGATQPRFRDVAGIRLAENLDALSRDEIEATQQQNLRATLSAALKAGTSRENPVS